MIVFQVKGQSHRLSRLKGKEKDVIKKTKQTRAFPLFSHPFYLHSLLLPPIPPLPPL